MLVYSKKSLHFPNENYFNPFNGMSILWLASNKLQTKTLYRIFNTIFIVLSQKLAIFFRFVHLIVAFYVEHNDGCYGCICVGVFGVFFFFLEWMSSIGTSKWHSKNIHRDRKITIETTMI